MANHDLEKIVVAVRGLLDGYLHEVNKNIMRTRVAHDVTGNVTGSQSVGESLLRCIDEILVALDKASSAIEPLRVIMQHVSESEPERAVRATENWSYAPELPDSHKIFSICGAL